MKRNISITRLLGLLLALSLCIAQLPATASAAGIFNIDSNNVLTRYNGPGGHVTIPEGITAIGGKAFSGCADVTGVTIPNSVISIGDSVFDGCTGLTSIAIPDSVTRIGSYAFRGCTGLTSIVIPDSVTTLGQNIFGGCTGLTSAVIGSGIRELHSLGGIFWGCTSLTSVTIKEGITSLPSQMFQDCISLTAIKIPDSVGEINSSAFENCRNLRDVDLGNGVRRIHSLAFSHCPKLKDITLPASIIVLSMLDSMVFGDVTSFGTQQPTQLDSITLAEGTQRIPDLSCMSGPSVTKLYVPASVTEVTDGALDRFPDLTVYGVKGGYMESWCTLRGIPFVGSAFADVSMDTWFTRPVLWAVENKITNGTSAAAFSPDDTCSTAQILTFLYRAKGSPAPGADNPFSDVSEGDYYYNAAQWAYENGLVSGSLFNGDAPCTRAMVVTYLWQLAGSPDAAGKQFSDVPAGSPYAGAVAWAVSEGITSGTGADTFSPDGICTRGQIVTFLYRAYQ